MSNEIIHMLNQNVSLQKKLKKYSEVFYLLSVKAEFLSIEEVEKMLEDNTKAVNLIVSCARRRCGMEHKKPETLKEAILIIGFSSLQNILIYSIIKDLYEHRPKAEKKFDIAKYWKHCLGTSVAAEHLSRKYNHEDPYKFFTSGLVHDIGVLVLDNYANSLLEDIHIKLVEGSNLLDAEKEVLGGITHADLGAWILEKLKVNEDIVELVRYHENPIKDTTNNLDIRLFYVADRISTEYYSRLIRPRLRDNFYTRLNEVSHIKKKDILDLSIKLPKLIEEEENFYTLI